MKIKATKTNAIALGIGAIVLAGSVIAGSHSSNMGSTAVNDLQKGNPVAEQSAEPFLKEEEIAGAIESQGYTDITKIELEDGEYEVKARDADGKRVEIYADPRTGEVLKSKYDD